jgi:hypothetical protein
MYYPPGWWRGSRWSARSAARTYDLDARHRFPGHTRGSGKAAPGDAGVGVTGPVAEPDPPARSPAATCPGQRGQQRRLEHQRGVRHEDAQQQPGNVALAEADAARVSARCSGARFPVDRRISLPCPICPLFTACHQVPSLCNQVSGCGVPRACACGCCDRFLVRVPAGLCLVPVVSVSTWPGPGPVPGVLGWLPCWPASWLRLRARLVSSPAW